MTAFSSPTTGRRFVTDEERRARLGARHGLAARVEDPVAATQSVVCLHGTEPASPYLSIWARTRLPRAATTAALYDTRSLVKQLAMRRTVFVFPQDLLPAVWGSASARVRDQIWPRLAREVQDSGIAVDGARWMDDQYSALLAALNQRPRTTTQVRQEIRELDRRLTLSAGTTYAANPAIANRFITAAGCTGAVQRGHNQGGWRTSRPAWTTAEEWLGAPAEATASDAGYRVLIERWLRQFGPGTETDLVWWLGATKAVVRRTLTELEAVEVDTEAGPAWLLPDDLENVAQPEPWAALLPVLDPTTMGWKQRDFYLGEHTARLFDRNGNAGTTAWWCGRIVGGWHQSPDGVVIVDALEDIGAEATAALAVVAAELTDWLDGELVGSVYHSPLSRERMRPPAD